MTAHFTEDQRSLARRLRANGVSLRDICKQISCSSPSHVQVVLKGQVRLGRSNPWTPRPGRLTMDNREVISFSLRSGDSMSSIARQIGRSPSMVTREVKSDG
jgi:IS30 family transposase